MRAFIGSDGGRLGAGFSGTADDCVVRALAHVTRLPYGQLYQECCKVNWATDGHWTARKGVETDCPEFRDLLERHGLEEVELKEPLDFEAVRAASSRLWPCEARMVRMYNHMTVLVKGIVVDSFDPSERWARSTMHRFCYSYYRKS